MRRRLSRRVGLAVVAMVLVPPGAAGRADAHRGLGDRHRDTGRPRPRTSAPRTFERRPADRSARGSRAAKSRGRLASVCGSTSPSHGDLPGGHGQPAVIGQPMAAVLHRRRLPLASPTPTATRGRHRSRLRLVRLMPDDLDAVPHATAPTPTRDPACATCSPCSPSTSGDIVVDRRPALPDLRRTSARTAAGATSARLQEPGRLRQLRRNGRQGP